MGRVYLKKDEATALIEAVYNVEDTAGPLTAVHERALDKLKRFGLSGRVAKLRSPEPQQSKLSDDNLGLFPDLLNS